MRVEIITVVFFLDPVPVLKSTSGIYVFFSNILLEFSLLQTVLMFGVLFKDIPIDILI